MEELIIRESKESDLIQILSLYLELDERETKIDKAREYYRKITNDPKSKIYVAELSDEIVGTFALHLIQSFAHDCVPSAVVEDVAVKRDLQGKGIGKAMMCFVLDQSKVLGCYKVALSSQFKRESAHRFYESLGFEKMGYSFVTAF